MESCIAILKVGFALVLVNCVSLVAQESPGKLLKLAEKEIAEILENEGERVRVVGKVEDTRVNSTGIHFLEFAPGNFTCVTFGQYVKNFEAGAPSEIYKGKWIEVSGEIQNYRGEPQIRLTDPSQVKIVEAPPKPKMVEEEVKRPIEPAVEPEKAVVEAKPTLVAKEASESGAPKLEMINGVEAVDWRKYFPK